jgi:hypothetical protein
MSLSPLQELAVKFYGETSLTLWAHTSFTTKTTEHKNFGGLAVCQPVRISLTDP